jgi:hypothetical protein
MRERDKDQSGSTSGGGLFGEASGGETEAGSYEATDRGGTRGKEQQSGADAGTGRSIPRGTDEHADSGENESRDK